jgi:hypothetical protein
MSRLALLTLVGGLGLSIFLMAHLGDRTAIHGLAVPPDRHAPFSAATVAVHQGCLLATDMDFVDPGTSYRQLTRRVLIYTEGRPGLELFAATVGRKMVQATPFLGQEGPGTSFMKATPRSKESAPVVFADPVPVTLVSLDRSGIPYRVRRVTIQKVQFVDLEWPSRDRSGCW